MGLLARRAVDSPNLVLLIAGPLNSSLRTNGFTCTILSSIRFELAGHQIGSIRLLRSSHQHLALARPGVDGILLAIAELIAYF